MQKLTKQTLFLLGLTFTLFISQRGIASESAIVLESLIQNQNIKEPWKSQSTDTIYNLALYIGDNRFLTTYRSISYAKSVTAQKIGEYQKFEMTTFTADKDLNLALLRPTEEVLQSDEYKVWIRDFKKIELAEEIPIGKRVSISRLGQNLTVKSVEGQILDVVNGVSGYGHYRAPLYRLDSTLINNTTQSEPIFLQEKLIGLSSYVSSGSLYALPATMIKDFISRSESGKYEGIPSVAFDAKATINPFERIQYGVPKDVRGGFMITSIDEISPFKGVLRENDLITKINGMSINYKAEVNHPVWEKVTVTYYIKRLRLGDEITIEGYRDGKPFKSIVKINIKYDSQMFLVPPYIEDMKSNYAVIGGLVFHNLSEDYLENWGGAWQENAPVDLVVEAFYKKEFIPHKGIDKVVVLSHVLPMEFNKGYHGVSNYILDAVNDRKVRNVAELVQFIESNESEFLVFRFKSEKLKIILYRNEVKDLRAKVMEKFGIPKTAQVR